MRVPNSWFKKHESYIITRYIENMQARKLGRQGTLAVSKLEVNTPGMLYSADFRMTVSEHVY